MLAYIARRLVALPPTLLAVTALLYGLAMLAPPEDRAQLYWPPLRRELSPAEEQRLTERIIRERGLDQPFLVQYGHWLGSLLRGQWGWSPTLNGAVLPALVRRTPVTAELTLYSLLAIIPLALVAGVGAGERPGSRPDRAFRLAAFGAASLPPFILALVLLAVFYVGLRLFPIGRISLATSAELRPPEWRTITGLITFDSLLNSRLDITLEALHHLALPVFSLGLVHWSTLARVTRGVMLAERVRPYVLSAQARGLPAERVTWRHMLRNALPPVLATTAVSAASLLTGVFVIERIFGFSGVSQLVVYSFAGPLDVPLALGFAIYSVLLVLLVMLGLDISLALADPRIRAAEAGE